MSGDPTAPSGDPGAASGDPGAPSGAGTAGASREAIEFHYDVGRDFYARWLDERMIYSAALWADPGPPPAPDGPPADDLESAQLTKLDHHAAAAGAGPGTRILDIGCGWGGMLGRLVEHHGVTSGVGLTLSANQADTARALGLPGVEIRVEDWRDHHPVAPYDGIVSIGAFEHFVRTGVPAGERSEEYRRFFAACWAWLVAGGRMSLQTIAMDDEAGGTGPVAEFLATEVFPESGLPRLPDVAAAADPWFRVAAVRADPTHYERTLHLWQRRLEANRGQVTALVGRDGYRRYLRYLRVCRAMFDRGTCTLLRVSLVRRDDPGRLLVAGI